MTLSHLMGDDCKDAGAKAEGARRAGEGWFFTSLFP